MCVTEFVRREERGVEQGAESDGLPESVEEARGVLESLVERMTETRLDDFELVRGGGSTGLVEGVCIGCCSVCVCLSTAGQVC